MEFDEIKDETVKIKPKRKKSQKAKPVETQTIGEAVIKVKKVNKRKTTKKKKVSKTLDQPETIDVIVGQDIVINPVLEDQNGSKIDEKVAFEQASINETQPKGQAGVSQLKVAALGGDYGFPAESEQISESKEPAETNVSNIVVSPISVFSNNSKVESMQTTILPFAAIKIRNIVGTVNNLTAEVIPNKVIVQGIIHEQIFFVGNDGIVHHLANDENFSAFVDVPGAQPGMNVQLSAIIEDIIAELATDGLSVLKKLIIELFVKVTESVQINLEIGNGPILFLKQVVGENSAQTLIENDVTLFTPAVKIDEIVGAIRDITINIIPNKAIIQGILHKQIFFVDTSNLGRHQAEDIPFSIFVDIPGAQPGMDVLVNSRIEAIFFNLISPTIVREKVVLEFFVKVTENIRQSVAIGTGPLLKVEEFVGENTAQELIETTVALSTPTIKIREIIAQVQNPVTFVIPDKVIIQGTLHKQIFFIGTDNIEHHQAEDVPFSLFVDIPGVAIGDLVHVQPIIEGIFFELISSTELRQKVIIEITAIVTREIQLNLVIGIGPLFKMEQVVGENTKQILIVQRQSIIPVTPITPVITVLIVDPPGQTNIVSQQTLLRNTMQLPVNAIKVKEIQATVSVDKSTLIPEGILIEGVIDPTVIFVGTDNIVRTDSDKVPYSILVNITGISLSQITNTRVEIEDILFNLNNSGNTVTLTIILKATVEVENTPMTKFTVITDVSGPGINVAKVWVNARIDTPSGPVFQDFDVVTEVSGPGIIGVTKQTVMLRIVGEPAPSPITVVTSVQIS